MKATDAGVRTHVRAVMAYLAFCAVCGRAADIRAVADVDLSVLLSCARSQDVSVLVYEALVPYADVLGCREGWDAWVDEAKRALRRSLLFGAELSRLTDVLRAREIPYMLLKGAALAPLYPKAYMRQMGDVDLWVDEKDVASVRAFLQAEGYVTEMHKNHLVCTKDPIYNFEIHTALFASPYGVFANHYSQINKKTVRVGNGCERVFSEDEGYIYLVLHEMKHAENGGIGLRALIDRACLLRARPVADAREVRRTLSTLGALAYDEGVSALVCRLCDDPSVVLTEDGRASLGDGWERLCEFLEVNARGSYGRLLRQSIVRRCGEGKITAWRKLVYLFGRIFPGRAYLVRYAERHCPRLRRALLLAFFHRIFKRAGRLPRYLRTLHSVR